MLDKAHPITYGYARVSSRDQNLARQLEALAAFGIKADNIFVDKASGHNFERPEWMRLTEVLRMGDVLVVKSIDRLGRNYEEIIEQWRAITKVRQIDVVVLDMPLLDTRKDQGGVPGVTGALISDITLQLLSYVAQVERENIRQRQREGIDAAKARGVRFGRPRKKKPRAYKNTKQNYLDGSITRLQAAQLLDVSVSTFDKWMREDKARVR